jgi:hypothetical protein
MPASPQKRHEHSGSNQEQKRQEQQPVASMTSAEVATTEAPITKDTVLGERNVRDQNGSESAASSTECNGSCT